MTVNTHDTVEGGRLAEARSGAAAWKRWGPYLSERQWGTVREDYSPDGEAWDYFPHDHARSRAYRWGEDGLAGISDDQQRLCFALALWNGRDPILKERLFGLTGSEGNHGEDVKEYYFYLDATPTASYMKMLYKYPQAAFPYADLVETNRRRSKRRAGVRADRHRRLRRGPLLRRRGRVRQGRPRRHPGPDQRHQPRPGAGRAAPAAAALVPQHLVLGRRRSSRRRGRSLRRADWRRHRRRSWPSTPSLGATSWPARARRRCCSPRTRPTLERLFGAPNADAVRQGRHPRGGRPRAHGRGQPGRDRHQGGGPLPPDHRARRDRDDPPAAHAWSSPALSPRRSGRS